jgi:phosphate acetyltransferase
LIDPHQSPKLNAYAERYFELRQHKNVSLPIARDRMQDPNYFGSMMVYLGECDGMVSGAMHTTDETIRPALEFIKTQPGCKLVSSVFLICLKDRVLVYGDCAVNPDPDAETLSDIAFFSAKTAEQFGIEPRIALLSYSSGGSGTGASVDKVRDASLRLKTQHPELLVEGPIQYDAAVDPSVAEKKMPNSPVAGRATVLIFPDLNSGNNTYKAVQRETGAIAIGPILQGLNKPVNDLSRGCTVKDIVNTIIITAIQAQGS